MSTQSFEWFLMEFVKLCQALPFKSICNRFCPLASVIPDWYWRSAMYVLPSLTWCSTHRPNVKLGPSTCYSGPLQTNCSYLTPTFETYSLHFYNWLWSFAQSTSIYWLAYLSSCCPDSPFLASQYLHSQLKMWFLVTYSHWTLIYYQKQYWFVSSCP